MRRRDFLPGSLEARAYRRVRRKMRFYTHALVFVIVNLGLYTLHVARGHPEKPMFIWGWAIALAIHGAVTFASLQGEGLRERMLREEIERMRRDQKERPP